MIARGAGCVVRTLGETVLAALPRARVGDGVFVRASSGALVAGRVAAVERARVSIAPFGPLLGIAVGDRVEIAAEALDCVLGYGALGRALDAAGGALDERGAVRGTRLPVTRCAAPAPHERRAIDTPFWTGIRAIDGLLTLGRGARVGIFGAPGAGKTTLLETIAAGARGDAVVLGLVGERGREAQAWLERVDRRTTVVCATSDRSAAERVRAADVALAQAIALRRRGLHVVLVLDSLARYAAALREARVALGEPVGRGGYPPGVWAELARYLEGAGNAAAGSITLLATVLSDGGDEREPLSDAARSLLDGHLVLASDLARAGHHPAIDVLASASRTMNAVAGPRHRLDAQAFRAALARLHESKELRALGFAGEEGELGRAVAAEPAMQAFLRQREPSTPEETLRSLRSVAALLEPR
ncbi:MAG: EscN/YscN/HrcN family type III secretion system ATPase [Candidatus Baltobacteraceae bacterium]